MKLLETKFNVILLFTTFYMKINNYDFFSAILTELSTDFGIKEGSMGFLQTVFIISYMIFAPLFGYLGDRYNRKIIMAGGVFLWCLTTFIGSYMKVKISTHFCTLFKRNNKICILN